MSAAEIAAAHLAADFEAVRTRGLRAARDQRAMLADALEALNRGATHITAEFIARVMERQANDQAYFEHMRFPS